MTFSSPQGPIYSCGAGTSLLISKDPLLPDPYEQNHVFVKSSRMKGGGEGLFAKINLAEGEIVAFYNGVKQTSEDAVSSLHKNF